VALPVTVPALSLFGIIAITTNKLNSKNYMSWSAYVRMWFRGHGVSDHLTKRLSDSVEADKIV